MKYTIENKDIKIEVDSLGAQLTSLVCKEDGIEHLWQADPAVWKYSAPILFPYVGDYGEDNPKHGFARDLEHTLVRSDENVLEFELTESPETLAIFPWKFKLTSHFELAGNALIHVLKVENTDDIAFSFGIGYHPGFNVPFDNEHSLEDYEVGFSHMKEPIQLEEGMFDDDSKCFENKNYSAVGLFEKGKDGEHTGRSIIFGISEFPYILLWGKPGRTPFVCIEPWECPPPIGEEINDWSLRKHAATLEPGKYCSTSMSILVRRNPKE